MEDQQNYQLLRANVLTRDMPSSSLPIFLYANQFLGTTMEIPPVPPHHVTNRPLWSLFYALLGQRNVHEFGTDEYLSDVKVTLCQQEQVSEISWKIGVTYDDVIRFSPCRKSGGGQ